MQRRFRPGRQAFIGAAAAALLGLGLGAWLKPPLVEAADPDPYENVVISLPAEASGSGYGLVDAGWTPAAVFAAADSPDSGIDLADAGERIAGSDPQSLPWETPPAEPDRAALLRLDEALPPPPADGRPSWPSARGDILAVDAPADPAEPPSPPQPAQARSQDPRDWDLPASAYARDVAEARPQLVSADSPVS